VKRARILAQHSVRQTFAGFYFFHPYNARLVAAEAALVHRFLTYLSRAKNRACLKALPDFLTGILSGFPVSNDVLCAG
jgi:hypothetical protein